MGRFGWSDLIYELIYAWPDHYIYKTIPTEVEE